MAKTTIQLLDDNDTDTEGWTGDADSGQESEDLL